MHPTLDARIETAARISIEASQIPMKYFRRSDIAIDQKADESPVTIADRETESFIRNEISKAMPDHAIFGEEFGVSGNLEKDAWIIDPIDGTRFFITGFPTFGMLLGLLEGGVPKAGIVRMPALDETYIGHGKEVATRNGERIRVSDTTKLSEAKLFINEAEKTFAKDPDMFGRLCKAGHTRRTSYDCYPHAMVADGRIDAVTDMGLEPYDYLPLVGLVEAAGGFMTDWHGNPLGLQSDGRVVTAATPQLHAEILELLN